MKVGFTGTQKGMTEAQQKTLKLFFETKIHIIKELHHGDCIGADAEAHAIARKLNYIIIIHPPIEKKKRAFCQGDSSCIPKYYIERNHEIVDSTDFLLVAPKNYEEERRSGTWTTYRYARRKRKMIVIIYPDGTYVED